MARFDRILSWIENFLAASTLGAAAALAIISVIMRYVFNYVIFWSEEAIIYLVIFSTFVGAVVTLRHDEHVNVDIIGFLLGERGRRYLHLIGAALVTVYCGVIGFYAWILVTEPGIRNTITPALKLPLWIVYLGIPIGLTLMFVRSVEILFRTARGRETFPEAGQSEFEEEEVVE